MSGHGKVSPRSARDFRMADEQYLAARDVFRESPGKNPRREAQDGRESRCGYCCPQARDDGTRAVGLREGWALHRGHQARRLRISRYPSSGGPWIDVRDGIPPFPRIPSTWSRPARRILDRAPFVP